MLVRRMGCVRVRQAKQNRFVIRRRTEGRASNSPYNHRSPQAVASSGSVIVELAELDWGLFININGQCREV